ncbi:MAG: class I SAM-dependent methyltransferase [Gemmiger sp.]|nr:class I SAM-dependent methyltransferase [Gemmiger sp.]
MDNYPDLFGDQDCRRLLESIDYDFEKNGKKAPLFGCLEAGVRQYDLCCEARDYLQAHPRACVVNLGCGLDTSFYQVDNGTATGCNLDMPDVIAIRNELLPPREREHNIACNLNDPSWFDKIPFQPEDGIVFIAGGVFYYFTEAQVKALFCKMAAHFPGGRLALDVTSPFGLKLMLKTWIQGAEIQDVGAYFSVRDAERELKAWSSDIAWVTHKKYMTGYRAPDTRWGFFNCALSRFADWSKLCQIAVIGFQ